mgnify:CR=1 FL=1
MAGKIKEGRKWFDGKDEKAVVAKLEEATAIDASVEECLFYADISKDSYYRYLKAHNELRERLVKLREKPVMLARQTAVKKMTESYSNAMDYLKRKRKHEFGDYAEYLVKAPTPLLHVLNNNSNEEDTSTEETH